jgi:rhodanese-related sulfurtransferase
MLKFLLTALFLLPLAALAGDRFQTLHISDYEALAKKEKNVALFDANNESTRTKVGLIHGAKALSGYNTYAATELPQDKSSALVFYCANKMCTASHEAAERAVDLGYKKVYVLVDGVYGWRDAKKPLDPYQKGEASHGKAGAVREVTPLEAKKLLEEQKAALLDVREGEERHEVIHGAQWLPLSKAGSPEWNALVEKLDKGKPVVVHCAMGKRARKVAEMLSQKGFEASYFQGPDQWKAAGLGLEKGPAN